MTAASKVFAQRTVTGVVAGMVAAVAAATGVGFWLSYDGLHAFALHAGMSGPQAWAWPASVDLFIAAGEAGVTIAALRRTNDVAAWVLLALGFGASVTANVLHVDTAPLHWTHYAATVPPIAAMLALAALMRQVYQLAVDRHVAGLQAVGATQKVADIDRPKKRPSTAVTRGRGQQTGARAKAAIISALAADPDITTGQLATMTGLSDRTVRRVKAGLNGTST